MILPTKRISPDRSLVAIGADALRLLKTGDHTVSQLWTELQRLRTSRRSKAIVTYDWFVLSLDLLFAAQAIEWHAGMLRRTPRDSVVS